MSIAPVVPLTSDHFGVYRGDTWGPYVFQMVRIVADAIAVGEGDTHLRSDSAVFTAADVGVGVQFLTSEGLIDSTQPAGLTIASRTDASHVVLSGGINNPIHGWTDNYVLIQRLDLTGVTSMAGEVRATEQNTTVIAAIAAAVFGTATAGQVILSMASDVTDTFPAPTIDGQEYRYDVQATYATGPPPVRHTLMRGPLKVVWDVQRP